jgi:hypothetical protein
MYTSIDSDKNTRKLENGYGFNYLKNTSETCEAKAVLWEVIF